MPNANASTNGTVVVTTVNDDKKITRIQVQFSKRNVKALEALASAYGTNDARYGKPITVPLMIHQIIDDYAQGKDTLGAIDGRGWSTLFEDEDTNPRNRVAMPDGAEEWPEPMQDFLRGLDTKAHRDRQHAFWNAEVLAAFKRKDTTILDVICEAIAAGQYQPVEAPAKPTLVKETASN